MPRTCTVCAHDERDAIEDAFLAGTSKRRIAAHYAVSEQAVRRHVREHLPALLSMARDAEQAARADTLLDRVEALYGRTEAILEAAETERELGLALQAIRECRGNLELLGRVTKELQDTPTLNLYMSPQWVELRTTLIDALEPHPEAVDTVLRALESVDGG